MVSSHSFPPEKRISEFSPHQINEMDALLHDAYMRLENETPRTIQAAEDIIEQTHTSNDPEVLRRRAYAFQLVARLAYRHMNFVDAISSGLESFTLYETLDDINGMYLATYVLGIVHSGLGDVPQALEYLTNALDYAERAQDAKAIGSVYGSIAALYLHTEQYDRAMEALEHALQNKLLDNDVYGLAVIKSNWARTQAALGNHELAVELAEDSIALALELKSAYLRVHCEITLGDLYARAGKFQQAIDYFEKILAVCRENQWLEFEIATLSKVGSAYLGIGQAKKAITLLEEGLSKPRETLSTYTECAILEVLISAYEQEGDYKQALQLSKRLREIQKQQITEERNTRLNALEQSFQMRLARHEAEQQRQRALEIEKRAQEDRDYFNQLNQIKDEFLSSATHDLKNPLATIRVNAYILRHRLAGNPIIRHVDQIEVQSAYMAKMISDMLELAKLETGRSLKTEITSLYKLIKDSILEQKTRAESKSLTLRFQCDVLPDETLLNIDPLLMERALSNLLSNAIKYTVQGEIVILLRRDTNHFIIEVRDHGIGIAEEDMPHIFTRFYRVKNEHTQNIEGTGLGLSIVKSIVSQHNGEITVQSVVNEGTTFMIRLPVAGLVDA